MNDLHDLELTLRSRIPLVIISAGSRTGGRPSSGRGAEPIDALRLWAADRTVPAD